MTDEKEKKAGKMMGMDPMSEVWETKCLAGAASHGPEAVEICKKDIKTAREWHTKTTFTDEELKRIKKHEEDEKIMDQARKSDVDLDL